MQKILPLIHLLLIMFIGTFGARSVFALQGPRCPHFLVQDGDDADSEPDHVPTVPFKSECRLQRDVLGLVETLKLESGTKLNCQGHKITPAVPGNLGGSNSRSSPELALFVHQVDEFQVQGCTVEGFNHGILVADSKTKPDAPYRKINDNVLKVGFVGIHVVGADNVSIEGNDVTWMTNGGSGILAHYNSDRIEIKKNIVVGDFSSGAQGAVLMPGPSDPTNGGLQAGSNILNANPVFTSASNAQGAIMAIQIVGEHPQLFNALIGGHLYQFTMSDDDVPNENFSEDNIVEDNTINLPQNNPTERTSGINASNSRRTTVRGNTIGNPNIHSMLSGVRAGSISGPTVTANRRFPGHCSADSTRLCLSNFDCNIPGLDSLSKGTCAPTAAQKPLSWRTEDLWIENNTIYGPFFGGMTAASTHLVIIGNSIHGPIRPGGKAAITLDGPNPLEEAVVLGNTIEDVTVAINMYKFFQGQEASFFGAAIGLNNIQRYQTAIFLGGYCERSVNTVCWSDSECILPRPNLPPSNIGPCKPPDFSEFPIELSVDAQNPENKCGPNSVECLGNYWGRDECPGFDQTKVQGVNGMPVSFVTDSNAFLQPVAGLPLGELPENCGDS